MTCFANCFSKYQRFDCGITCCSVRNMSKFCKGLFELIFRKKNQWSAHMDRIGLRHPSAHTSTNSSLHLLSGHIFHWCSSRRNPRCFRIFCHETRCQRVRCVFCTSKPDEIWSKPALTPCIHHLFIWTVWFRQSWCSWDSDRCA